MAVWILILMRLSRIFPSSLLSLYGKRLGLQGSEKVANIWFANWIKADQSFGEELKAKVLETNGGKFGHANAVPASMA
jgi:hypothetical protein